MTIWKLTSRELPLPYAFPGGKRIFCCLCLAYLFLFGLFRLPALASIAAENLFAQGTQAYLAENYAEARDLLAQAAVLDPQNAAIQQALGLCYLARQEYQDAYRAFRTALYLDPQIKRGRVYLGISQYFLGQYQQAQDTLTLARQQDPNDGLTRYYLGLCALQLGQPQRAQQEFSHGYRLSPEYANNFKPYEKITLVPKDVRPQPFRLELLAGLEYDSNVALQAERDLQPRAQRKKGSHVDWAGRLGGRLEYYPLLRPNYNLGLRLNTSYHQHTWLDNWNWFNTRADAFVNFKAGPILLQPLVGYDYTLYSAEEFTTFHIYGLTINWPETKWLVGELIYQAWNRQFHYGVGSEYKRNGWLHKIGLYQGILLPDIGIFRFGAAFERDLGRGLYVPARTVRGTINSVVFLPWNLSWWAILEYAHTDFDNYDENLQEKRRDNFYQVQLLLKKPLRSDLALWLGYGYNTQRSTQKGYQYDRHLFKVSLTYDFF
ncbi:MAG: tetratricopeptide repeat protein [Deltaproteobacteria bacterium]|nr:tetratricopeptide repeat protein [Deltaproteobacteria bacterium]